MIIFYHEKGIKTILKSLTFKAYFDNIIKVLLKNLCGCGGMADASDSKSDVGDYVRVQVPPSALKEDRLHSSRSSFVSSFLIVKQRNNQWPPVYWLFVKLGMIKDKGNILIPKTRATCIYFLGCAFAYTSLIFELLKSA